MALTKPIQDVCEGNPVATIYQPVKAEFTTLLTELSNGSVTQLGFNAGSAAVPGLFPAGNTNTGLFSPFANALSFANGGVESVRISATGKVGLRTTAGFGFDPGGGGSVTQGTSRTTGVTLNAPSGVVTMFTAAGSATWSSFTITSSAIQASDVVGISYRSSTNDYIFSTKVAAGSVKVNFATTGGTASDTPIINFTAVGASAS